MTQRPAILWCKLRGQRVEIVLEPAYSGAAPTPGVPAGWRAAVCLSRTNACYGTGCSMTTDGGECPFGKQGERINGPPENFDPGI